MSPSSPQQGCPPFRPDPSSMLWHYANGRLPMWTDQDSKPGGAIGWVAYTHRGVQLAEKLHVGRKQKQNVFNNDFDFRIDTAFHETVKACADARAGQTWITPAVLEGYGRLYDMGFAHSFEIWQGGTLVGGTYGVQLAGYVTLESMFHHVPNASKSAYVRAMLHLFERGFKFVDVNGSPPHVAKFGGEWVPQWRFMELLRAALKEPHSVTDARPAKPLPWRLRLALPAARVLRKVGKLVRKPVHRLDAEAR